MICVRLKLDKGSFYHMLYRVEQRVGRALAELEPYPLFPVDEYFAGPSRLNPPDPPVIFEKGETQ
jgi:hypothetical protein